MSREILKAAVLACYLQVNRVTLSCFSEFTELTSPSLCTHDHSFPRLDWTGGCVCILIVNKTINGSTLLWLLIIYFSLFVWFWIKKYWSLKSIFSVAAKTGKHHHSKKQMFYLPSESIEQRRLFCNKYLAFSQGGRFERPLPTDWCSRDWESCIQAVFVNKTGKGCGLAAWMFCQSTMSGKL